MSARRLSMEMRMTFASAGAPGGGFGGDVLRAALALGSAPDPPAAAVIAGCCPLASDAAGCGGVRSQPTTSAAIASRTEGTANACVLRMAHHMAGAGAQIK